MTARLFIILVCALVAGCAGGPRTFGGNQVRLIETASLPTPDGRDSVNESRPYVIGPFDKLRIDVFGIPELTARIVQTDAGGRISFPIAGVVDAAGKTPGELETALRERLRAAYVRDPQVTVNLEQTVSQVVTIDGEVREPGLYPVIGRMTMLRAVASAKGLGEFAKLDEVVVFRTVNGQRYAALYNIGAIRSGVYADPEIYANDVIVVGNSRARRVFKDFLQLIPLLTTPLIVALQRL